MSKDDKDEKSDKSDISDKSDKAMFISRCIAYILDSILVLFVASLLAAPFVNTDDMLKLTNQSQELVKKYNDNKISDNEYLVEISNLEYKMARSTELVMIVNILIGVLYFVVLPLYYNGQTLGKKLMKIKITSTVGELSSNQLIFRSFIANFILLNIISVLFVMFASRNIYAQCVEMFTFAQYVITVMSIFMVIIGREGLAFHDKVARTKVIKVN